jgi:hydroxyacylglutathione hydrolase
MAQIIPIPLGITKAFLVKEEGAILIDTGSPNDEDRIIAALRKENVAPRDLKLIVQTHGHYDHCGSTRRLKNFTSAPVAIHRGDAHLLRKGVNDPLKPIKLAGQLIKLISNRPFEPAEPDLIIDQEMDLRAFGVGGKILFTPGHTAGSISVLLDGGRAIVGDLMVGGYFGGYLIPKRPGYHYFADDVAALRQSIKKVMDAGATEVFVAHGGPLERQTILDRFKKEIAFG